MGEFKMIVVREWDADAFHRRVAELEAVGYEARLDSYRVAPEMNPETGEVIHLRSVEMCKSGASDDRRASSKP